MSCINHWSLQVGLAEWKWMDIFPLFFQAFSGNWFTLFPLLLLLFAFASAGSALQALGAAERAGDEAPKPA